MAELDGETLRALWKQAAQTLLVSYFTDTPTQPCSLYQELEGDRWSVGWVDGGIRLASAWTLDDGTYTARSNGLDILGCGTVAEGRIPGTAMLKVPSIRPVVEMLMMIFLSVGLFNDNDWRGGTVEGW